MRSFAVAVLTLVAVLAGPVLGQSEDNPRLEDGATGVPVATGRATGLDPEVEVAFWDTIKDSGDPMLYLAYLEQFPEGAFRVIARNRLEDLWERATRAFALLDEMGVSLDAPGRAPDPAPEPIVTPAPPVVLNPPVIVTPTPKPTPDVPSAKLIRNAQNQLRKHKCYKGGVDGVWGEVSRAAMRRFNRRAGTSYPVRWPTPKALSYMREMTRAGIQICR